MFQDNSIPDIKKNEKLKNNFLNADLKKINLKCNIYNGNFFMDSFNYFLISEDLKTFKDLFTRENDATNKHFFTNNFFENFSNNKDSFKEFNNVFVIGSNGANNYYSNLLQFLPRVFFINKGAKDIKSILMKIFLSKSRRPNALSIGDTVAFGGATLKCLEFKYCSIESLFSFANL